MTRRRVLLVSAIITAVLVVAGAVAAGALAVSLIRRSVPDRSRTVDLAGLGGQVTVLRDARGVPEIYADDPGDLFRVQGYLHAQDRFFQMDLRRHVTAGRLSELVGANADALRADSAVRTLGWRRTAQREYATLDPATRGYLQAYADGVNHYLRGRRMSDVSVSYTILARANPMPGIEKWTPVDSLAWLKAMAWDLKSDYSEELTRARAITTVRSVERVDQLFPEYPFGTHAPIVTGPAGGADLTGQPQASASGLEHHRRSRTAAAVGTRLPGRTTPAAVTAALASGAGQQALAAAGTAMKSVPALLGSGDDVGSNSWVVGGGLTSSGKPLLANDPHLAVSVPGVWYQVGLHCRRLSAACPFDVAGFGFAGMPGVVIGHNTHISWGLTNLSPDVTDFYLERVGDGVVDYDGRQVPLTVRTETIRVAGARPVTLTIRSTRHGPLISDVLDDVAQAGRSAPVPGEHGDPGTAGYAVALDWTGLLPGHAMQAMLALDRATTFAEFRKAALLLDAPAQNIVYADTDGNIGYQAPGRIPIRGPGSPDSPVPADGTWPHPGWDGAYDWKGFVPVQRLPWVENPPEGYIVAANQAVIAPRAGGVQLTRDWDYGFRSQRIRDLLARAVATGHRLTVADMQGIQTDTRNGVAAVLVPWLLRTPVPDSFTEEAVDLLRGWDYEEPADSAAAAYFNVVWAAVLNLTFSDELPDGFRPDGGDRWFEVVTQLLNRPRDPWWDDRRTPDVVESRDEVLRRALSQARLQLTSTLGKDPDRWAWGRLHQVYLTQSPLGGQGSPWFVHELVNRGPYDAPGGSAVVNAFGWDAAGGSFDVNAAPSMRMVVDLGALDGSRWVNQTGVSDHPLDDHYADQIHTWLTGESYPWPFTRAAVEAAAGPGQQFRPSGEADGAVSGRTATGSG